MLKENDKIRFHYLKQFKDEHKSGQVLTDYATTSEEYSGKIVDVRNIIDHPVSQDTIRRANIKGRRSEVFRIRYLFFFDLLVNVSSCLKCSHGGTISESS